MNTELESAELESAERKGFITEIIERLSKPWGAPF